MSDAGVGVGGPECGACEVPNTKIPDGMMEADCGEVGIWLAGAAMGEVGVEIDGEFNGSPIHDWPEGADDMLVASEVERPGDVHSLVG